MLIGGQPEEAHRARLERDLALGSLRWLRVAHGDSFETVAVPALTDADVTLAMVMTRWRSHRDGPAARSICRDRGIALVELPGGYGSRRVAHELLAQASDKLAPRGRQARPRGVRRVEPPLAATRPDPTQPARGGQDDDNSHDSSGVSPSGSGDTPAGSGRLPASAGDTPEKAGDVPVDAGDTPGRAGGFPKNVGEMPAGAGGVPADAGGHSRGGATTRARPASRERTVCGRVARRAKLQGVGVAFAGADADDLGDGVDEDFCRRRPRRCGRRP